MDNGQILPGSEWWINSQLMCMSDWGYSPILCVIKSVQMCIGVQTYNVLSACDHLTHASRGTDELGLRELV